MPTDTVTTRLPLESPPESAVLWDVAGEHFGEVEYLLGKCQRVARSPKYTLSELESGPFARLAAHLDGLVLSGEAVVPRLIDPAVEEAESPERLAGAALVALTVPTPRLVTRLAQRVASTRELGEALIEALAWSDGRALREAAPALRAEQAHWPLLLRAGALRGVRPGPELDAGLTSKEPVLVAAALRAIKFLGEPAHQPWVDRCLRSGDAQVGELALDLGLAWGSAEAWAWLRQLLPTGNPAALLRSAGLGSQDDCQESIRQAGQVSSQHAALFALGFSGWPRAAEACLEHLASTDLKAARLAGEAFAAITGLPLGEPQYWKTAAEVEALEGGEGDELPPLEIDLQTNLMPPDEASLQVPVAEVIRDWWSLARPLFDADTRYLQGRVLDAKTVRWAFTEGESMRRLPAWSALLGIRTQGEVWVPTQVAPPVLRAALAGADLAPPLSFQAPVKRTDPRRQTRP